MKVGFFLYTQLAAAKYGEHKKAPTSGASWYNRFGWPTGAAPGSLGTLGDALLILASRREVNRVKLKLVFKRFRLKLHISKALLFALLMLWV